MAHKGRQGDQGQIDIALPAVIFHQADGDKRRQGTFQNVSAESLKADHAPECDVLVTGDSPEAREIIISLAEQAGFTAWHAGPLQNSAAVEALTSLLIFMNKRYQSDHTGLQITGIEKT